MIKTNYEYSSKKIDDLRKYEVQIRDIVKKFKEKDCEGKDFLGWYEWPLNLEEGLLDKIENDAKKVKDICEVCVVCGIGGSYLGARSVIEAIKGFRSDGVEIVYFGNTFDERYISDTLKYLEKKDFCVNVISKSGTTLETAAAFRLVKKLLEKKYGEKAKERIYVTTDQDVGCLRELAEKEKYVSYIIPRDIGGRYSVFTPVGLFPLAVAGVDIKQFVKGAKKAFMDLQSDDLENNIAYQYAAYRYDQYVGHKNVELFVSYSPYLNMIGEWWKQLFGESEGKNEKGLFPASVNFSTDLHSLGQFIQQGSKILFITQLKIAKTGSLSVEIDEENIDNLNYLTNLSFSEINLAAQEGTNKAHYQMGNVDNFTFVIDDINEQSIGYLLFLFMYSCMISAYLLRVNPFDQPGVEFYKSEMKKILKK